MIVYQYVQTYVNIDEKKTVLTACCFMLFKMKLTKLTSKCGFEDKVVDIIFR